MLKSHWFVAAMLAAGCTAPASGPPTKEAPASPPTTVAAPAPAASPAGDAGLVLAPLTPPVVPANPPRLELPEPGVGATQGVRAPPESDAPPAPQLSRPYVPAPKLDSRGRGPANKLDPMQRPTINVPPKGPSYQSAPVRDH